MGTLDKSSFTIYIDVVGVVLSQILAECYGNI